MPFDNVILSSGFSSRNDALLKTGLRTSYTRKFGSAQIICYSMSECDKLADATRSTPQQFSNLKVLFSHSDQKSQQRESTIRLENIVSDGMMAIKLEQCFREKPYALLTVTDEKKLLTELSTNVLIDELDVVSPATESQIYNSSSFN